MEPINFGSFSSVRRFHNCSMAENQYYDILLVGKTGSGKSTTGNKLLGRSEHELSAITRYYHKALSFLKGPPENDPNDNKTFVTADDVDSEQRRLSVTGWCEVLGSKVNNIRILDVPGFSDSGALTKATGGKVSVYQGNLLIFRWIVRVQAALKITTNRVVYFLPTRGPMEKVDGVLVDELKVMHHFFGTSIFENMVVVATNPKRKQYAFDDEDRRETQEVFHTALKLAIDDENVFCPPLIYIAISDTGKDILAALESAPVKSKKGMELKFRDDVCAKCTVRTRYAKAPGSSEFARVGVIGGDGETIKYEDSKCHTKFVSKYSGAQKVWGGIGHVFTLGIALAFENHWPGFTNADEMCENCKCGPGSVGCTTVGDGRSVDHSNKV